MGKIDPNLEKKRQDILKACKEAHEKEQEEVLEEVGSDNVQLVLCFALAGQKYGIEIEEIREIAKNIEIYPVPGTKDFVLGVINIRGEICAVVDPLMRLGRGKMSIAKDRHLSEIIIFKNLGDPLAIAVDEVSDLIETNVSLDPNTSGVIKGKAKIIEGKNKEVLIGILDPERLFFDQNDRE